MDAEIREKGDPCPTVEASGSVMKIMMIRAQLGQKLRVYQYIDFFYDRYKK